MNSPKKQPGAAFVLLDQRPGREVRDAPPLPKAKVEVIAQSGWARQPTTDAQGSFKVALPWKGPTIEVRHTDRTPGERGGQKYDVASFVTT